MHYFEKHDFQKNIPRNNLLVSSHNSVSIVMKRIKIGLAFCRTLKQAGLDTWTDWRGNFPITILLSSSVHLIGDKFADGKKEPRQRKRRKSNYIHHKRKGRRLCPIFRKDILKSTLKSFEVGLPFLDRRSILP